MCRRVSSTRSRAGCAHRPVQPLEPSGPWVSSSSAGGCGRGDPLIWARIIQSVGVGWNGNPPGPTAGLSKTRFHGDVLKNELLHTREATGLGWHRGADHFRACSSAAAGPPHLAARRSRPRPCCEMELALQEEGFSPWPVWLTGGILS